MHLRETIELSTELFFYCFDEMAVAQIFCCFITQACDVCALLIFCKVSISIGQHIR